MSTLRNQKVVIRLSEEDKTRLDQLADAQGVAAATIVSRMVGNQLYPDMYLPDIFYPKSKEAEKEKPHIHKMTMYLTDEEYEALKEDASRHGYTARAYLQHIAMHGSVILDIIIPTVDVAKYLSLNHKFFATIYDALARLVIDKTMSEEQYQELKALLDENTKQTKKIGNEILRLRRSIKKDLTKKVFEMVKKSYVRQQCDLMVKNGEVL